MKAMPKVAKRCAASTGTTPPPPSSSWAVTPRATPARWVGCRECQVVADKARLVEDFAEFGVTAAPAGVSRFDGHQRAFVKVQDGCLLNCSYCIIPHVRPTVRSRPAEEIADEVSRLVENGYRESC